MGSVVYGAKRLAWPDCDMRPRNHPTAGPKGSFSVCSREWAGLWAQHGSSYFPTCRYIALYYHHDLYGVKCGASSLTLRVKLFPPAFLRASYFLPPFGLYCSVCLGILLVSILCKCCSHSCWQCPTSRTQFCTTSFSQRDWFLSPSNLLIPTRRLKYSICDAFSLRSSLFFSAQTSIPNFQAALAAVFLIIFL
jgi:hypothetical protein